MKRQNKLLQILSLLLMTLCVGAAQGKPKVTKTATASIAIRGDKLESRCYLDAATHDVLIEEVDGVTKVWVDENDDREFTETNDDNSELAELPEGATWADVDIFAGGGRAEGTTIMMKGGKVKAIYAGHPRKLETYPTGPVTITISGGTLNNSFGVQCSRPVVPCYASKVSICVSNITLFGYTPDNLYLTQYSGDEVTTRPIGNLIVAGCTLLNNKSPEITTDFTDAMSGGAFVQSVDGKSYILQNNSKEEFTIPAFAKAEINYLKVGEIKGNIVNQSEHIKINSCQFSKPSGWTGKDFVRGTGAHQYKVVEAESICQRNSPMTIECTGCNARLTIESNSTTEGLIDHEFVRSSDGPYNTCLYCGGGYRPEKTCDEHVYQHMEGKAASCMSYGYDDYYYCTKCAALFDKNFNEVEHLALTLPTWHSFTNIPDEEQYEIKASDATCTEPEHYFYRCEHCLTFSESLLDTYPKGKPLGHAYYIKNVDSNSATDPCSGVATFGCARQDDREAECGFVDFQYNYDYRDCGLTAVNTLPTCHQNGEGKYEISILIDPTHESEWMRYVNTQITNFIPHKFYKTVDGEEVEDESFALHEWNADGRCPYHPEAAAPKAYVIQTKALDKVNYYIDPVSLHGSSFESVVAAVSDINASDEKISGLSFSIFEDASLALPLSLEKKFGSINLNGHKMTYDGVDANAAFKNPEFGVTNGTLAITDDVTNSWQTGNFYLTASKFSYDRKVTPGRVVTFVLPIDVPVSNINGEVYRFSGFEDGTFNFAKVNGTADAHAPYLVKVNPSASSSVDLIDGTVEGAQSISYLNPREYNLVDLIISASGVEHFGSYETMPIPSEGDNANYYGFASNDGAFVKVLSGSVKPYRTAFRVPTSGSSPAKIRLQLGDDEADEIIEVEADKLSGEGSPIYDLQGRRIDTPQQGHIYISNGKKILK